MATQSRARRRGTGMVWQCRHTQADLPLARQTTWPCDGGQNDGWRAVASTGDRTELATHKAPGEWHPLARQLHVYWLSKSPLGRLPGREHIDPLEMRYLLPHLLLVDVVGNDAGPRFRFRVCGTRNVERLGTDDTGKWFEEAFEGDGLVEIQRAYAACVESREPQYDSVNARFVGKEYVNYSRLICPLAADGETIDMVVGVLCFD